MFDTRQPHAATAHNHTSIDTAANIVFQLLAATLIDKRLVNNEALPIPCTLRNDDFSRFHRRGGRCQFEVPRETVSAPTLPTFARNVADGYNIIAVLVFSIVKVSSSQEEDARSERAVSTSPQSCKVRAEIQTTRRDTLRLVGCRGEDTVYKTRRNGQTRRRQRRRFTTRELLRARQPILLKH